MRRFHVHVSVEDLDTSIAFYSRLFGEPVRVEADYAKWMVDDPRLNFAISRRGSKVGLNHLGIQVDSNDELAIIQSDLRAAGADLVTETDTSCCYARSDKHWVTDPQGIAWETFHTLGDIATFGEPGDDRGQDTSGARCCPTSERTTGAASAAATAPATAPASAPAAAPEFVSSRSCCA